MTVNIAELRRVFENALMHETLRQFRVGGDEYTVVSRRRSDKTVVLQAIPGAGSYRELFVQKRPDYAPFIDVDPQHQATWNDLVNQMQGPPLYVVLRAAADSPRILKPQLEAIPRAGYVVLCLTRVHVPADSGLDPIESAWDELDGINARLQALAPLGRFVVTAGPIWSYRNYRIPLSLMSSGLLEETFGFLEQQMIDHDTNPSMLKPSVEHWGEWQRRVEIEMRRRELFGQPTFCLDVADWQYRLRAKAKTFSFSDPRRGR